MLTTTRLQVLKTEGDTTCRSNEFAQYTAMLCNQFFHGFLNTLWQMFTEEELDI